MQFVMCAISCTMVHTLFVQLVSSLTGLDFVGSIHYLTQIITSFLAWPNQIKSNWRQAVQGYFPLQCVCSKAQS